MGSFLYLYPPFFYAMMEQNTDKTGKLSCAYTHERDSVSCSIIKIYRIGGKNYGNTA